MTGAACLRTADGSPEKDPAESSGTHADGLEQGPLVLPLELCADLHQVHLAAGHHDPGHHLLLGTFTLRGHNRLLSDVVMVMALFPR